MDKWIDIKKQLPTPYRDILVKIIDNSEHKSYIYPDKSFGYGLKPICWKYI